jgi:hypothetical protein
MARKTQCDFGFLGRRSALSLFEGQLGPNSFVKRSVSLDILPQDCLIRPAPTTALTLPQWHVPVRPPSGIGCCGKVIQTTIYLIYIAELLGESGVSPPRVRLPMSCKPHASASQPFVHQFLKALTAQKQGWKVLEGLANIEPVLDLFGIEVLGALLGVLRGERWRAMTSGCPLHARPGI